MKELLQKQDGSTRARKARKAEANRNVLKRIVDTVFLLGKQGLAFRGHRELLIDDSINTGNFLEALKYLSEYDPVLNSHLEKVKAQQREKHAVAKDGKVGRDKKLTFLSMNTQNKIIDIVGKEIAAEISSMIHDCRAWVLISDTTPDVTKHKQLSVCVRIVSKEERSLNTYYFAQELQPLPPKRYMMLYHQVLKQKELHLKIWLPRRVMGRPI